MKALILAGGSGTRLRPITYSSAKQLVPIANKPILVYGIEAIVAAGITNVGIIVGDTAKEIQIAVGDGSRWGIDITYLPQGAPLGLAHCVLVARDFLANDPFVMYLGDNMIEEGLLDFTTGFVPPEGNGPDARILLAKVDEPSNFGVAAIGPKGNIDYLVEKPSNPPSDLALVGAYLFGPAVHDAVRAIRPSVRGELEITDAIQWLLDEGRVVEHRIIDGWWIDTGKKDPLLTCNRLVLDTLKTVINGQVDDSSVIEGQVQVEDGALISNSRILGPSVIGANVVIEDSMVGPYASIGDGCWLREARLDHSVLLPDVTVIGPVSITDSLVGRNTAVRQSKDAGWHRLTVGDHSEIEVG